MKWYLQIFHSTHYSGADLILQFGLNEPWKKVFGPVFIHLNSLVNGDDPLKRLWEDAKQQVSHEKKPQLYYSLYFFNNSKRKLFFNFNCLLGEISSLKNLYHISDGSWSSKLAIWFSSFQGLSAVGSTRQCERQITSPWQVTICYYSTFIYLLVIILIY